VLVAIDLPLAFTRAIDDHKATVGREDHAFAAR
jgi:hypothetical protein